MNFKMGHQGLIVIHPMVLLGQLHTHTHPHIASFLTHVRLIRMSFSRSRKILINVRCTIVVFYWCVPDLWINPCGSRSFPSSLYFLYKVCLFKRFYFLCNADATWLLLQGHKSKIYDLLSYTLASRESGKYCTYTLHS